MVNLNVNTITDSQTAFSRRLVEILGCGGFVLSNRTRAIDTHFADYCHASDDPAEIGELFDRLCRDGLSPHQQAMRSAASEEVRTNHSWGSRLAGLVDFALEAG
nr:glycosyltransferase [Sphingomicrobium aestuariivivum]